MKVRQKEPTRGKTKDKSAVRWLFKKKGLAVFTFCLTGKSALRRDILIFNPQIKQAFIKILLSLASYEALLQNSFR